LQALEGNISIKREMFHDKNYVVWRKMFSEGAKPIYKLAVGNSSFFHETSKLPADDDFLGDEVLRQLPWFGTRSVARGVRMLSWTVHLVP
jgi:hypothetical protein